MNRTSYFHSPPLGGLFMVALLLGGCAKQGVMVDRGTPDFRPSVPIELTLESCVDRTDTHSRDLGGQATAAFRRQMDKAAEFVVESAARYRLFCEVTIFTEGSALKRWVMPGWGATVGQVSAMLSDTNTGEILIIVKGNATVASGGLYTIGAEEYIVPTAVSDVIERMRDWALGKPGWEEGPGRAIPEDKPR